MDGELKVVPPQIKVGQFKDGLDMSAIREVKFLRELKHPNVIEVNPVPPFFRLPSSHFNSLVDDSVDRCIFEQSEFEPRPRIPRHRSRSRHQRPGFDLSSRRYQELDVDDFEGAGILPQELGPPSGTFKLAPFRFVSMRN